MPNRTPERREFLEDILYTAATGYAEAGIPHRFGSSQTDAPDAVTVVWLLVNDGEETRRATADTVARAFGLLRNGPVRCVRGDVAGDWLNWYRECDAGQYDAGDAMTLVEIGLWGSPVYG